MKRLLEAPRRPVAVGGKGRAGGSISVAPQRRLPLWAAGAAAVAVLALVGYFALRQSVKEVAVPKQALANARPTTAPVSNKSIAVLPFANLSDDKEANAFFADGIHEDILTNLSSLRELRVTSRTSAMQYRDTKKSIRQIGEELQVAYILEGSVRRTANRVRITGQLIKVATDEHLWAKNYDRELSDVFALQAELSHAIAVELRAAISPEERQALARPPTENLTAYDLYLKARALYYLARPTMVAREQARQLLERAIELDPKFLLAWAQLVREESRVAWSYSRSAEQLGRARRAVDKIMELAPQSPDTLFALAEYHYRVDGDNLRAIAELRRVEQVRPNDANVTGLLAAVLRAQGQWKESLENFRRAVALDPANLRHLHDLASVLAAAHRFDEARTAQRRLVERTQDAAEQLTLGWLGYLATGATAEVDGLWRQPVLADDVRNWELSWAMRTGNMAEAIRLDRAGSLGGVQAFGLGSRRVSMAIVRRVQGNAEWGKAELEQTAIWFRNATAQGPVEPTHWANLAQIEAMLGNREDALRCARKAIELSQSAAVHAVVRNTLGSTLAFVEAWTDAKDAAIERYARQLQLPYGCTTVAGLMAIEGLVTVHVMKRDPTFAPLRGHPRWEALLNDPKNNAPLF